jgi:hypothetical protein
MCESGLQREREGKLGGTVNKMMKGNKESGRERESYDGKALRQQQNCHDGWRQIVSLLFVANASVFVEVSLVTNYFYPNNIEI